MRKSVFWNRFQWLRRNQYNNLWQNILKPLGFLWKEISYKYLFLNYPAELMIKSYYCLKTCFLFFWRMLNPLFINYLSKTSNDKKSQSRLSLLLMKKLFGRIWLTPTFLFILLLSSQSYMKPLVWYTIAFQIPLRLHFYTSCSYWVHKSCSYSVFNLQPSAKWVRNKLHLQ